MKNVNILYVTNDRELKQLASSVVKRMPTYLFLETVDILSVDDIIKFGDHDLFKLVVKSSIEQFRYLLDMNLIKRAKLDNQIHELYQLSEDLRVP